MNSGNMNCQSADWRKDLEASRDVTEQDQQHYGFVLAWHDSWRMRLGLPATREAAVRFWREQVQAKPRKDWPGFAALRRGELRLEMAF